MSSRVAPCAALLRAVGRGARSSRAGLRTQCRDTRRHRGAKSGSSPVALSSQGIIGSEAQRLKPSSVCLPSEWTNARTGQSRDGSAWNPRVGASAAQSVEFLVARGGNRGSRACRHSERPSRQTADVHPGPATRWPLCLPVAPPSSLFLFPVPLPKLFRSTAVPAAS